jgi:hypothetical protein
MFKWLENIYKREDEKFIRIIQDASNAEKRLSTLYQVRINLSIGLIGIFILWLLSLFFGSGKTDTGFYLALVALISVFLQSVDSEIKMINYLKPTLKK